MGQVREVAQGLCGAKSLRRRQGRVRQGSELLLGFVGEVEVQGVPLAARRGFISGVGGNEIGVLEVQTEGQGDRGSMLQAGRHHLLLRNAEQLRKPHQN